MACVHGPDRLDTDPDQTSGMDGRQKGVADILPASDVITSGLILQIYTIHENDNVRGRRLSRGLDHRPCCRHRVHHRQSDVPRAQRSQESL